MLGYDDVLYITLVQKWRQKLKTNDRGLTLRSPYSLCYVRRYARYKCFSLCSWVHCQFRKQCEVQAAQWTIRVWRSGRLMGVHKLYKCLAFDIIACSLPVSHQQFIWLWSMFLPILEKNYGASPLFNNLMFWGFFVFCFFVLNLV